MEQTLSTGAHLVTPRRGYTHHGIYVGGGRVIHYAGFKRLLEVGPVEEISLEEFGRGHGVAVKPWAAPKFTGDDVAARARSRMGEHRYSVFENNCEHLAEWCITGTSRSPQIEALATRVLRSLGLHLLSRGSRLSKVAALPETSA